ncbi:MAG: ABC transporter ATP-binding protein [Desulfobacteraceae bacterium]|nr:ABC transporter ATP-binding protein [Desulfobacteraceae bacterium]
MENESPAHAAPIVEMENISKSYWRGSQRIAVLQGIDLRLDEGCFVALMGPSGSGKTTLLNLIGGIDRPDEGRICVAGTEIAGLGEAELARWRANTIGFVFQFYNLIPVLTGLENVELPLTLFGLNRKERREHALLALELVGLADRVHHYPRELSGGQQQRVAIARAIATDPSLIVADEPTGDLDKNSAAEVLDLLERLNLEFHKTVIMVTHDPKAAEKARVIHHLDKGTLSVQAP